MDCTSSMGPYIVSAKKQIRTIIEQTNASPIQLGFVGYRDIGEKVPFFTIPFTSNITLFLEQLGNVEPEGGLDICEDVAGGFEKVLKLDWSSADIRTVVHIADAPPHGKEFHDNDITDNYPNNDFNILEKLMDIARKGIDYMFIKVNTTTNIMYEKFKDTYDIFPARTCGAIILPYELSQEMMERTFTAELTRTLTEAVSHYTSVQSPEAD